MNVRVNSLSQSGRNVRTGLRNSVIRNEIHDKGSEKVGNVQRSTYVEASAKNAKPDFPSGGIFGNITADVVEHLKVSGLWDKGAKFDFSLPTVPVQTRDFSIFGAPAILIGQFNNMKSRAGIRVRGEVREIDGDLRPFFRNIRIDFGLPCVIQLNYNRSKKEVDDFNESESSMKIFPVVAAIDGMEIAEDDEGGLPRVTLYGGRSGFTKRRGWRMWAKVPLFGWISRTSMSGFFRELYEGYISNDENLSETDAEWSRFGSVYGAYAVIENIFGTKISDDYIRRWGDSRDEAVHNLGSSIIGRLNRLSR